MSSVLRSGAPQGLRVAASVRPGLRPRHLPGRLPQPLQRAHATREQPAPFFSMLGRFLTDPPFQCKTIVRPTLKIIGKF